MKRFCSLFINIILSVMVYGQDETIVPHIVQRGETINILASRFKTSVETLKMLNNDFDEFYTGMNVFLPRPNELRNTSELSIDEYDVYITQSGLANGLFGLLRCNNDRVDQYFMDHI